MHNLEAKMDIMETIKKRASVRSYLQKPVEEKQLSRFKELMERLGEGPFGNPVRFKILNLESLDQKEMRSLGTYGVIKGARCFLAGVVKEGAGCMEDLGYCMEHLVLEATSMELGTCWLGGTFRRSNFARQAALSSDELLPAIVAVGHPADKDTFANRFMKVTAGSHKRKPWEAVFYSSDGKTPLGENQAEGYATALEAVRLAPSALNRQPWRVVKGKEHRYHFYLNESFIYNRTMGKIHLQNLDMGIAMCHFSLAAHREGLYGSWEQDKEAPRLKGLQYTATWVPV